MSFAKNSLLFLLLLFGLHTSAQQDTISSHASVYTVTQLYKLASVELSDSVSAPSADLDGFQNYQTHFHIGNTGLPIQPVFISQQPISTGFQFRQEHSSPSRFSFDRLNYCTTRTPYSSIFFLLGTKKEQFFDMTFSYNLKPNWNITADFQRIRSEGFYKRQQTNDNDFSLNTNFRSKTNRYWLFAAVLVNSRENAENGGVQSDSAFQSNSGSASLIEVNLSDAQSKRLKKGIQITQFFNLGKFDADTNFVSHPSSNVQLQTTLQDQLNEYSDASPGTAYYPAIYFDSTSTYDSAYFLKLENYLSWKRLQTNDSSRFLKSVGWELGIRDQWIKLKQKLTDTSFMNLIPSFSLYNFSKTKLLFWRTSFQYCINGYNEGDYLADGELGFRLSQQQFQLGVFAFQQSYRPNFQSQRIGSNHFVWNNSYSPVQELSGGLFLNSSKTATHIRLQAYSITKPVYYDQFAAAKQYNGSILLYSATLSQNFSFFNWHLNNTVCYQLVPDSTVLHYPAWVLQHALYYEHDLFKHATHVQIGLQLTYNSNYYALSYMPVTGNYYLQDTKLYGNYPFVDFFLNAKVKNFRLFFKVDHLNAGLSGTNYLVAPNLPYAGRTFKLGILWQFFD